MPFKRELNDDISVNDFVQLPQSKLGKDPLMRLNDTYLHLEPDKTFKTCNDVADLLKKNAQQFSKNMHRVWQAKKTNPILVCEPTCNNLTTVQSEVLKPSDELSQAKALFVPEVQPFIEDLVVEPPKVTSHVREESKD